MAKQNRPSVQKREREQKKRQRERVKAEKAAEKRERRFNQAKEDALPPGTVGDDVVKSDREDPAP